MVTERVFCLFFVQWTGKTAAKRRDILPTRVHFQNISRPKREPEQVCLAVQLEANFTEVWELFLTFGLGTSSQLFVWERVRL